MKRDREREKDRERFTDRTYNDFNTGKGRIGATYNHTEFKRE